MKTKTWLLALGIWVLALVLLAWLPPAQSVDEDELLDPEEAFALAVTARDADTVVTVSDIDAFLGETGRLAVGDPEHVPAGIYAQQALVALGLWDGLESRLARAENVRAALALVARGEAPLGIVYATDARAEDGVVTVAEFDASTHAPIGYSFARLADSRSTAPVRNRPPVDIAQAATGGSTRR